MYPYSKPSGFGSIINNYNVSEETILNETNLDFMNSARSALQKIEETSKPKKDILKTMYENLETFNASSNLYECYDPFIFESKLRVDMLYYENLLRKCPQDHVQTVQKMLTETFQIVRKIYEHVNIKPEIHGNGIDEHILEISISDANEKISQKIFEHIDKNFYNMDPEMRKQKYLEESRGLAKKLINENTDVEKAIEFSVKTLVMESLLTKISFPFTTWTRIKELCESEEYGLVFDKDVLENLVETFENKTRSMSKIIAAIV